VRRQNRSRSSGGNGGSSVSISYSEEKRALMLPQEVKELPHDDELIFKEGCKVIRAKKNWFFKDKQFQAWTQLPPVAVEPLGKRLAVVGMPPGCRAEEDVQPPQNEQMAAWLAQ
jgi:type IV secretion system protein VirD4